MTRTFRSRFLVIGGGGYIGFHIALDLCQKGYEVTLYDIHPPIPEWGCKLISKSNAIDTILTPSGSLAFVKGDVCDRKLLFQVAENVMCVIHVASYGMSGKEQMPPHYDKTEEVNIGGTANVIEACYENGVEGLVYTSTYNVIFGGDAILNGDESLPYFPLHRHLDHYSRTKSVAERLILSSNGKGRLKTCALRLAGVIGKGEQRHLPRILQALRKGFIKFTYYDKYGGIVDYVGIQNVVQAHVKAALLICSTNSGIGGNAYFISDGKPINSFRYFQPLMEELGFSFPKLRLPMWFMHLFASFIESLYAFTYRWASFTPIITRTEVLKTGITHHFKIEKARRDLGYNPTNPNDLTNIIKWHKNTKL